MSVHSEALKHFFRHPKSGLALIRNLKKTFRYELVVCAIFKDEAPYLDEWLAFHSGVGIEHFYLYNNESSDNYLEALSPWIDAGRVTLIDWPHKASQRTAYQDCIAKYRRETRWIAFIDIDEFLFSPTCENIESVLPKYYGLAALFVYWRLFGSSGNKTRPSGPVIESYTRALGVSTANTEPPTKPRGRLGKSIVNPRLVKEMGPHAPKKVWAGEVLDENLKPSPKHCSNATVSANNLRINHYWSKSIAELENKISRGRAAKPKRLELKLALKREASLNEVSDYTILRLWREIRAKMPDGSKPR